MCNNLAFAQKSFKCVLEARGHLTVEAEGEVHRCSSECCHYILVIIKTWAGEQASVYNRAERFNVLCTVLRCSPELSRDNGVPWTNNVRSLKNSSTRDEQNWFVILCVSVFNLQPRVTKKTKPLAEICYAPL